MARHRRFGKPVKVALIHHSPEKLRAKAAEATRGAKEPHAVVVHTFKRRERVKVEAVKHSFVLPS